MSKRPKTRIKSPARRVVVNVSTTPTSPARIARIAERHPRLTLATAATVVGILFTVAPAALWLANYYETRSHAKLAVAKINTEFATHQISDARAQAWAGVGTLSNSLDFRRSELVLLRNRVNECNIARDDIARNKRRPMSVLETTVCFQYNQELEQGTSAYNDLNAKLNEAKKFALKLSQEKVEEKKKAEDDSE